MTELSFLIDLLLNQKLNKQVKELVANRIRDIETKAPQAPMPVVRGAQAPSTIANMTGQPLQAISHVPSVPLVSAEGRIVGGEVSTGNGIKGPRKF